MAKARLINKKTQEIRVLDDSYVRIFPNTWEYASKKGAAAPEPVTEPIAEPVPNPEPVAKPATAKKVGK